MTDFPLPGTAEARVVAAAPGEGPGYWAGAPAAVLDGDTYLLAYRVRNGHDGTDQNVVARSGDGETFETLVHVRRRGLRRDVRGAAGARADRRRLATVRLLRHPGEQGLVDRGARRTHDRGAAGRRAPGGVPGRRAQRRQGPDRAPRRGRPLARVDLLPPARHPGRGGPHEHGLRDERRRPELGLAGHDPRGPAGQLGRARRARDRRAARRADGLRRPRHRRGELVREDRPVGGARRAGRRRALPRGPRVARRRAPHLLRGPARRTRATSCGPS